MIADLTFAKWGRGGARRGGEMPLTHESSFMTKKSHSKYK